ncbi:hypothetical protein ACFQZ2_08505 [Streptomonospora algeriensis]|uniref:Uncharacterized protein n=1 Tax=Streptomonospora algeriensis TaxID=995084 RepID=A0ABW3BF24_9ACTN
MHESQSARTLQQQAIRVLTRLIEAELPIVGWQVNHVDPHRHLFVEEPYAFPVLTGQARSHSTVRAWAAHLNTDVELAAGSTPSARTVIEGIGVRVWCAPAYGEDVGSDAGEGGERP